MVQVKSHNGPVEPHNEWTRATREELEPWIIVAQGTRLDRFAIHRIGAPTLGWFLRSRLDGDPVHEMTTFSRGYLDAAVDRLILWADHAVPLKFHPDTIVSTSRS